MKTNNLRLKIMERFCCLRATSVLLLLLNVVVLHVFGQLGLFASRGLCNFRNPCFSSASVNATCSIDPRAPILGPMICTCPPGYSGDGLKAGSGCRDIDECRDTHSNVCSSPSERCMNTPGSFKCLCANGFRPRPDNSVGCVDINECEYPTLNTCDPVSQVCQNLPGSYKCICSNPREVVDDFTGRCRAVNLCSDSNGILNPCNKKTTYCVFNVRDGAKCLCKEGYHLNPDTGECEDIDECADGVKCPADISFCRNLPGSFECVCDELLGFTQSAENPRLECTNLNECLKWSDICGDMACCRDLAPSIPPRIFSGFECASAYNNANQPSYPAEKILGSMNQFIANNDPFPSSPFANDSRPSVGLVYPRPNLKGSAALPYAVPHVAPAPRYVAPPLKPSRVPPLEEAVTVNPLVRGSVSSSFPHKAEKLTRIAESDNSTPSPSLISRPGRHLQTMSESELRSLQNIANLIGGSLPMIGSATSMITESVDRLIQIGECPSGFVNIRALKRSETQTKVAKVAGDVLKLPFTLDPDIFGRGIVDNLDVLTEEMSRWIKALVAGPMKITQMAQNVTDIMSLAGPDDLSQLIEAGKGVSSSVLQMANRWAKLLESGSLANRSQLRGNQ